MKIDTALISFLFFLLFSFIPLPQIYIAMLNGLILGILNIHHSYSVEINLVLLFLAMYYYKKTPKRKSLKIGFIIFFSCSASVFIFETYFISSSFYKYQFCIYAFIVSIIFLFLDNIANKYNSEELHSNILDN